MQSQKLIDKFIDTVCFLPFSLLFQINHLNAYAITAIFKWSRTILDHAQFKIMWIWNAAVRLCSRSFKDRTRCRRCSEPFTDYNSKPNQFLIVTIHLCARGKRVVRILKGKNKEKRWYICVTFLPHTDQHW